MMLKIITVITTLLAAILIVTPASGTLVSYKECFHNSVLYRVTAVNGQCDNQTQFHQNYSHIQFKESHNCILEEHIVRNIED
jgi:hypothetical protein